MDRMLDYGSSDGDSTSPRNTKYHSNRGLGGSHRLKSLQKTHMSLKPKGDAKPFNGMDCNGNSLVSVAEGSIASELPPVI